MLKRIVVLLTATLFITGSLAACGEEENGEENQAQNQAPNDNDPNDNDPNGDSDAMVCEMCAEDADCGDADNFECVDGFCEGTMCEADEDCANWERGWAEECDAVGECDAGQHCVDLDGEGYCAIEEQEGMSCDEMDMAEYDEVDMDGEDVTVCGMEGDFECDDGACVDTDADENGEAEGCETDEDCDDIPNADTCYDDGTCGCSDSEVCDNDFECVDSPF